MAFADLEKWLATAAAVMTLAACGQHNQLAMTSANDDHSSDEYRPTDTAAEPELTSISPAKEDFRVCKKAGKGCGTLKVNVLDFATESEAQAEVKIIVSQYLSSFTVFADYLVNPRVLTPYDRVGEDAFATVVVDSDEPIYLTPGLYGIEVQKEGFLPAFEAVRTDDDDNNSVLLVTPEECPVYLARGWSKKDFPDGGWMGTPLECGPNNDLGPEETRRHESN